MNLMRILERIFKLFSSIQLAIFILISLGILSATGTIYEARYDAVYAQKLIYHSPYMVTVLGLLCVNLLSVMIDRYPWRRHHTGFVLAHIGIMVLIFGSFLTNKLGVDGNIAFDIGQKQRFVSLSDTEVVVYATYGEGGYRPIWAGMVDFFRNPPEQDPLAIPLGDKTLKAVRYLNFALPEQKITESKSEYDGPAARIQLQNQHVNLTQWLSRPAGRPFESFNLGPAQITLADKNSPYSYAGGNEIVLRPGTENSLRYEIYTRSRGGLTKKGVLPMAEAIETGWMGLKMRLLKYLPRAERKMEYTAIERPTGLSTSAVAFDYDGHEYWVGLNSSVRLFSDSVMYLVTYRHRPLDLGFEIQLTNFDVGKYQGTNRAMSYESTVQVDGGTPQKVFMNNPLKHNGYTFYQASFQEDEMGRPTTSILSVNKDPGRPFKYLGSLLMVCGTIVMFYFKRMIFSKKESP